jgi:6-phosphogluconolactonase
MKPEIRVFPDINTFSRAAAGEIVALARRAVAERGRFSLVLSGGTTPRILYNLLATEYSDKIPWEAVHLFFGDERFVPKDDPESNFAMADEALISKIQIPEGNIHPVPTHAGSPGEAAQRYEREIKKFLGEGTFDLVLLGMGDDGHTASLFPGNPVLEERERWVAAVEAPGSYRTRQRVTMTLPLINRAGKVFFLVAGEEKREVLEAIMGDPGGAKRLYPAALVSCEGGVEWFVDRAALKKG